MTQTQTPDTVVLQPDVNCTNCHISAFPAYGENAHKKHTEGLYNFACSTCHFGHGDGTADHMNGVKDITFNPTGMAFRNGNDSNTPVWNSGIRKCTNIYCHSNGRTAYRGTDGTYTWSSTTGPQVAVYDTTPNWDTGKITACTYCHNGLGNMAQPYTVTPPNTLVQGNYPASGKHQMSSHMSNNQDFSGYLWGGVQCFWCHNPSDSNPLTGPLPQGTYSTSYHVDGNTYFKPLNINYLSVTGGTMANGLSYSSNGSKSHCGNSMKCW